MSQTDSAIPLATLAGPRVAASRALERQAKPRAYAAESWRRFRADKPAMLGLVVLLAMLAVALGADAIAQRVTGHQPYEQDLRARFAPIGAEGYLLGADDYGRDTATRLAYGARVSLGIAALSIAVALLIGVAVGLVSGFYGGWIDSVLMRGVDVLLAIPGLFLLLLVASMWRMGPVALALVIAALGWLTLARLVRGEVLSAKERDYVQAARVIGSTDRRQMWRHMMPNIAPVVIVWASLTLPTLILAEAGLSYLGLGVQPPTPSWGNMLSNAQRVWGHSPALALLPGLAIYVTVFSINLVGNGLRDALDPRLQDDR